MTRSIPEGAAEPRWGAIVFMTLVGVLATSLPSRYELLPHWFPWTAYGIVVASMLAVQFAPTSILWHRVERSIVLVFVVFLWAIMLVTILRLVADMVAHNHDYGSLTLLESGALIWTLNVAISTLLYWQIDRGGAEARASDEGGSPDFIFAEAEEAEHKGGWAPEFVDYLFLAFTTSTSFTPPDYSKPASRRAKVLVMIQASVSLVTLVLIASRAVATLS